jgi:hypothetical protein
MDKKNLVDANVLAARIENLASCFYIPTNTPYYNTVVTQQAMAGLVNAIQSNICLQITTQVQAMLRNLALDIRLSTTSVNECMLCHKQEWEDIPSKS